MKLPVNQHLEQPWRVHAWVEDFDLLDVWRLPVEIEPGGAGNFDTFARSFDTSAVPERGAAGALFKLRLWLGRVFGWDEPTPRSIPGCVEQSVLERLPQTLRDEAPPFDPERDFQLVFHTANERLMEISNSTVHALVHFGVVTRDDGGAHVQMAVYCKPRGLFGRLYMAAITPFRLWIVYPALMKHFGRLSPARPSPSAGANAAAA